MVKLYVPKNCFKMFLSNLLSVNVWFIYLFYYLGFWVCTPLLGWKGSQMGKVWQALSQEIPIPCCSEPILQRLIPQAFRTSTYRLCLPCVLADITEEITKISATLAVRDSKKPSFLLSWSTMVFSTHCGYFCSIPLIMPVSMDTVWSLCVSLGKTQVSHFQALQTNQAFAIPVSPTQPESRVRGLSQGPLQHLTFICVLFFSPGGV